MSKRDLHPEERDLWRRTMRDVRRLQNLKNAVPQDAKLTASKGLIQPRASSSPRAVSAAAITAAAPRITPRNDVIGAGDPGFDKRVARRRLHIEDRIDLHGMTQAAAEVALRSFLLRSWDDGRRCVLVITGKGGFAKRGVLHSRFGDWVNGEELRRFIARVSPAHQKDGGGGAWYVFLKRKN